MISSCCLVTLAASTGEFLGKDASQRSLSQVVSAGATFQTSEADGHAEGAAKGYSTNEMDGFTKFGGLVTHGKMSHTDSRTQSSRVVSHSKNSAGVAGHDVTQHYDEYGNPIRTESQQTYQTSANEQTVDNQNVQVTNTAVVGSFNGGFAQGSGWSSEGAAGGVVVGQAGSESETAGGNGYTSGFDWPSMMPTRSLSQVVSLGATGALLGSGGDADGIAIGTAGNGMGGVTEFGGEVSHGKMSHTDHKTQSSRVVSHSFNSAGVAGNDVTQHYDEYGNPIRTESQQTYQTSANEQTVDNQNVQVTSTAVAGSFNGKFGQGSEWGSSGEAGAIVGGEAGSGSTAAGGNAYLSGFDMSTFDF